MKRRFVAVLMAGGLVMGLCGCGSKTVSADDYMAQTEREETPTQDDGLSASGSASSANDAVPEGRCLRDYSVTELVDMLASGEIAMRDIEFNVATGDVSYEDYEEILTYFPEEQEASLEQEATQTATDEPLEKPVTNVNPADYMSTYVWEYEDFNGYQLRETINLSPIFSDTEGDLTDMYALWEALGGTAEEIPSKDELYEISYPLSCYCASGVNNMTYILGTRKIDNLTEGFPATNENPINVNCIIGVDDSLENPTEDKQASGFVLTGSTTLIFSDGKMECLDGTKYTGTPLGNIRMTSDAWGPTRFIIILPNRITPNQPNGFAYDSVPYRISFSTDLLSNDANFTLNNWSKWGDNQWQMHKIIYMLTTSCFGFTG